MPSHFFPTRNANPRSRPRDRGDADLDLTSLIDVVFLLLIFFMITSTMDVDKDFEVPQARSGKGVESEFATFVTLLEPKTPRGASVMILGNVDGVEGDIESVRQHVEQGVSEGRKSVIIKAEKKVRSRDVLRVAQLVGGIEGGELFIAVQELP